MAEVIPQFFRVSAAWMKACGISDEAQTFPVIRTESDKHGHPEYDILVLDRDTIEWPVFRIRGRIVPPYVLVFRGGRFEPELADVKTPLGAVKLDGEYQTLGEAENASKALNDALELMRESEQENGHVKDSVRVRKSA